MKLRSFFSMLLAVAVLVPAVAQKSKKDKKDAAVAAPAVKLESRIDSVSYGIGVLFGGNLAQSGFGEIKTDIMMKAISQVMAKQPTLYDDKAANEIVGTYFREVQKQKTEKSKKAGADFLEKNKTEAGVVVLPSGLQYKVIKEGTGAKPAETDKVTVHYHGTLIDGRVFDSSVERGQPIQLSVNGVIKGWQEALQLMSVGSKWKLFIPSDLGYGEQQMPGSIIEPNSVLVFEVELISIDKEKPADAAAPSIEQPQIQPQIK